MLKPISELLLALYLNNTGVLSFKNCLDFLGFLLRIVGSLLLSLFNFQGSFAALSQERLIIIPQASTVVNTFLSFFLFFFRVVAFLLFFSICFILLGHLDGFRQNFC